MPTINQLIKKHRKKKFNYKKVPALEKNPQKRGTCINIFTKTPRKPNSAKRAVARIMLSNKKTIIAHIPGEGHSLYAFANVLVRGGNTKDLPGIKYKVVRGSLDTTGVSNKIKGRSKYGKRKK